MKGERSRKRGRTRVSEDDLRPQLQLSRAVGGTVCFAKARQIRNVVARRSKNDGIKYVESFRPKLDAPTFSPERELPEDRRVKVPERGRAECIASTIAEGILGRDRKSAGVEDAIDASDGTAVWTRPFVRIADEIGAVILRPRNIAGICQVAGTVKYVEGDTGSRGKDIVDLPISEDVVKDAVFCRETHPLADWYLVQHVHRQRVPEVKP